MHTQFFSTSFTELSADMKFLGSSQRWWWNLLLVQETRGLSVQSALVRGVGHWETLRSPTTQPKLEMQETWGVWLSGSPSSLLHQQRTAADGWTTLLPVIPKERRYISSPYALIIKSIILLNSERQSGSF